MGLDRSTGPAVGKRSSNGWAATALLSPIALRDLARFLQHRRMTPSSNKTIQCLNVLEYSQRVTEFAPPMSRRQVTNRRELLLPLLIPDRHQTAVIFDPSVPPAPAAATNGNGAEPARSGTRQSIQCRAAKQAGQRPKWQVPSSSRGTTFWPGWCFSGSVHAAAQE